MIARTGHALVTLDAESRATMEFARGEAARQLEAEILPLYLTDRRWYGAKDAGAPAVRIEDAVALGLDDDPVMLILGVTPPGQTAQRYLLPVLALWDGAEAPASAALARVQAGASRGTLIDAFADDRLVRLLLGGIKAGGDAAHVGHSGLVFRRTAALADMEDGLNGGIERSTAEQSNTSLRIGGTMLKAFRKLEPGTHPELEVSAFLTERAGFGNVPALLGSVEHVDASGRVTALCVLQALVPNQGDGWTYALARLTRISDEGVGAGLLRLARQLGKRTAELHHALAMPTEEEAFAPEPVEDQHLSEWMDAVQRQARTALAALEQVRPQLDPALHVDADRLIGCRHDLAERIRRLTPVRVEARRTRLHGDYHLGQVLVSDGDVFIIDFEGEPMRPLAERRAKHSPLKDVAGMLRSFAYAGAAAEREHPAAAERLSTLICDMSAAFLGEYERTIQGCPSFPADPANAASLLRLFLLEKALYEVAYELANRPDWLGIPLAGVLALLDRNASTEVASAGDVGSFTSPTRKDRPSMAEPVRRAHTMPFSAEVRPDGSVRFRLWAPAQQRISLVIDGHADPAAMTALDGGWHELTVDEAEAGTRYRFALEDGLLVPDPASRHQPNDVHGPSEVIDPTEYAWRDGSWLGRPWNEAVVYELHVGTFTPEGTFRAAIGKLDHLVELGVTAIELMPIADFPGGRNWGYDGVYLFAPDSSYGRPDDLKALVDAAHARGLMVLLDVVYNHFGPDGNYLNAYACQFFTERHKTPWGAAINYDGADSRPVRDFMIHNALYWLEEYHFDGLRLDAVHAIIDDSETHLLEELAGRVRGHFGGERHIHLILENEENEAHRLDRGPSGEPRIYTAQWNDDVHHVLHTAATGEDAGYYAEYRGDTEKLARALAEGFAFQGEMMDYRGEPRGEPSRHLPPIAFVAFIQNHDQIGNRAFGDRLTASTPAEAVRAIAAIYLLAPQIPMLFMGEEWAAAQPFPFFCDFEAELGEAVRKGRREEFAKFPEFQDEAARERIPDPVAENTFRSAKLGWDDLSREPHAGWLDWYRHVLTTRRTEIVPRLAQVPGDAGEYETFSDGAFRVAWRLGDGSRLSLLANLSEADLNGVGPSAGRVVWSEGQVDRDRGTIGPWSLVWSIESGGDAQGAGRS